MRTINVTFDEKDFKKLNNAKEEAKINGKCKNWEDYFLKLAGVRK
jgi:hypothetical protein